MQDSITRTKSVRLPERKTFADVSLKLESNKDERKASAQKRWRKLKMVMKATKRVSSLTKPEEDFLKAVKRHSTPGVNTRSGASRGGSNSHQPRSRPSMMILQADLIQKSDVLTKAERKFISNLIELPGVSDAQLQNVHQVLVQDPIYGGGSLSRSSAFAEEKGNDEDEVDSSDDDEVEYCSIKSEEKEMERKEKDTENNDFFLQKELWRTFTMSSDLDRNLIKYETKASTRKFEESLSLRKKPLQASTLGREKTKEEEKEEMKEYVGHQYANNCVIDSFRDFFLLSIDDYEIFKEQKREEYINDINNYEGETNNTATIVNFFHSIFQMETAEEEKEEQIDYEEEEEETLYTILGTLGADDKHCFPHVLSPLIMDALRPYMPYAYQCDNYWLKYSMIRDGASLKSLLNHVRDSPITILAIETTDGDIFGSFTSSLWRSRGRVFYGSCEAFLWRLKSKKKNSKKLVFDMDMMIMDQIESESSVEIFKWSQKNRNIQSLLMHPTLSLKIGGGGHDEHDDPSTYISSAQPHSGKKSSFMMSSSSSLPNDNYSRNKNNPNKDKKTHYGSGLVLHDTLERGFSEDCVTFNSPCLVTKSGTDMKNENREIFKIMNVEAWTMTPVEDSDQAEQLEYGRHFVFDHSDLMNE